MLLPQGLVEIVNCFFVAHAQIIHSLSPLFLARCQMTIKKQETGVIVVEPETCTAFICSNTCCACFYFAAVRLLYVFLVIFSDVKHDVAAKHNFTLYATEISVGHSSF